MSLLMPKSSTGLKAVEKTVQMSSFHLPRPQSLFHFGVLYWVPCCNANISGSFRSPLCHLYVGKILPSLSQDTRNVEKLVKF